MIKMTSLEKKWVLYDVGNSAFTMLIATIMPIYFNHLAGQAGIAPHDYLAYWGYAASIVTLLVVLTGPVLGALADTKNYKKKLFFGAMLVGVVGCAVLGAITSWLLFLGIFILAKYGYSSSLIFYDAMLADVTTDERMDKVSSAGYAWGYIGSCIPFVISLALVLLYDKIGLTFNAAMVAAFAVTGVWWLCMSLPLMRAYEQKHFVEPDRQPLRDSVRRIVATLKDMRSEPQVLLFVISFFLYIDGVGTIIDNCINIGTDLGLPTVGQVVFLLATQVVAFGGSLVFARLSKKYDTVTLILICIVGYFCVCIYALFLHTLTDFAILAFGVGCFQGSIQSLSRSYFSKIIPAENSGEYFGIYDIFSKGASFLGSAVIAAVKFMGGSINIAVALLSIFFALGFIFLKLSDKQKAMNR